jgi:hypothetical protein
MIRLLLLLAVALPAWAQQAQTPPAEPKKEKEPERRPLNLRLDNPSSFATITPAEKEQQRALPTLGGDARKVESGGLIGERSENPVYPKDTAPVGR